MRVSAFPFWKSALWKITRKFNLSAEGISIHKRPGIAWMRNFLMFVPIMLVYNIVYESFLTCFFRRHFSDSHLVFWIFVFGKKYSPTFIGKPVPYRDTSTNHLFHLEPHSKNSPCRCEISPALNLRKGGEAEFGTQCDSRRTEKEKNIFFTQHRDFPRITFSSATDLQLISNELIALRPWVVREAEVRGEGEIGVNKKKGGGGSCFRHRIPMARKVHISFEDALMKKGSWTTLANYVYFYAVWAQFEVCKKSSSDKYLLNFFEVG